MTPSLRIDIAEAILWLHVVVIVFSVFGLVAIPLGAWGGWRGVRDRADSPKDRCARTPLSAAGYANGELGQRPDLDRRSEDGLGYSTLARPEHYRMLRVEFAAFRLSGIFAEPAGGGRSGARGFLPVRPPCANILVPARPSGGFIDQGAAGPAGGDDVRHQGAYRKA